jgi:mono/diheme cytochrome c family protein
MHDVVNKEPRMNPPRPSRLLWYWLPLALCLLPACQQQMAKQPSYRPDEANSFFPDGRAARPAVDGTVARGYLQTDLQLFAGKLPKRIDELAFPVAMLGAASGNVLALASVMEAAFDAGEESGVDNFPFPVTAEVLQHGQNRYMIYCVVCHDALGTGRGTIVERGYTPPSSYHIERLRKAPVGHLFQVITKGYGSMPAYGRQIPTRDRWAIIAYIRALQLSQHFPLKDLPDAMRREWMEKTKPATGGQP